MVVALLALFLSGLALGRIWALGTVDPIAIICGVASMVLVIVSKHNRPANEAARLRAELTAMRREYDREHHGMGVPGSDFHQFGGSYHDKDGNPL